MKLKKTFTFVLLLSLYLNSTAQVGNPNHTPFGYGVEIGGFSCSAKPPQNIGQISNRNSNAGFTFGSILSFRQSKYFIETGLEYSGKGYSFQSTKIFKSSNVNVKNEYTFRFLLLPIKLGIPIQGNRIKHLPAVAINCLFGLKQTYYETMVYENSPIMKNVYNIKSDYHLIHPSLSFAYGIEFGVDSDVSLRIEPNYQFSFLNAKNEFNRTTINSIGIKTYLIFLR